MSANPGAQRNQVAHRADRTRRDGHVHRGPAAAVYAASQGNVDEAAVVGPCVALCILIRVSLQKEEM